MKYIEELEFGETFVYNDKYYVLSADFKKDNSRMCISLNDGFVCWLKPDSIVKLVSLYCMDENTNIIPIKETKNKYVVN